MPNRSYALLYRQTPTGVEIYFPVKKDDAENYPKMPQFFGGFKSTADKSEYETVYRETAEESNNEFLLADSKGITQVFSGNDSMFYVTHEFIGVKESAGPIVNKEMKSLEVVALKPEELKTYNCDQLLKRLGIVPSKDFLESETYKAFDKAFKWLGDNLSFNNKQ